MWKHTPSAETAWSHRQTDTFMKRTCVCLHRMDDLAVDSDEEVDYSKMDQVTTPPSMHFCCISAVSALVSSDYLWHHLSCCSRGRCSSATQFTLLCFLFHDFILKESTGSEAMFCFRGTKRVRWVAGILTRRRSIRITWTTRRLCQSMC